MNTTKPHKTLCTLAQALAWGSHGRLTRKMDGEFQAREIKGVTFAGQLMRPKSGGFFTALDRAILNAHGEFWIALDVISDDPTIRRVAVLEEYRAAGGIVVEDVYDIAATMAGGAEGVCLQAWDDPYGEILAYKARWEGRCVVTGLCGGKQSVEIADAASGQPRGKIPLRGGKIDRVKVGSILKVNAMCLTDAGLLREPVLDADTPESWLVKV